MNASGASICCALLALLAAAPDAPRFAPRQGVTLERSLERELERSLRSVTLRASGQEKTVEDPGVEEREQLVVRVADEILAVEGGRVTALERRYEKLARALKASGPDPKSGEAVKREWSETCDLEGRTVRFRAQDSGDWKKEFADEEQGAPALLEPLEADMDLARLLPADAEEREKGWKLGIEALRGSVLRPGGRLRFHGEKPRPRLQDALSDAVWESLAGEGRAELGAPREEDGLELCPIAIEGTLRLSASAEREGDEPGPESVAVRGTQQFEGELLWDLSAGRAHSLTLEWTSTLTLIEKTRARAKDGAELEIERESKLEEREQTRYRVRRRPR